MGKIGSAVYIKRNRHYFNLKLKYKGLYIYLSHEVADFPKSQINGLNLSYKIAITAERLKSYGMKDRKVVAHGCRKTKKIICGMEEGNVVAHGRTCLPPLVS